MFWVFFSETLLEFDSHKAIGVQMLSESYIMSPHKKGGSASTIC